MADENEDDEPNTFTEHVIHYKCCDSRGLFLSKVRKQVVPGKWLLEILNDNVKKMWREYKKTIKSVCDKSCYLHCSHRSTRTV